jgi:hypothetical protein
MTRHGRSGSGINGKLAAIVTATVIGIGSIGTYAIGGTNPATDAGFEGYVYHDPLIVGERSFEGTQVGPSSTGLVWREYVENIDMRPDTFSEKYEIITNKDMNLTFDSHARISLKAGTIKEIVEKFGAVDWYKNNVMRPYRSTVREEVRKYSPFEVKLHTEEIAKSVLGKLQERYKGTPIVFETLDIGNIDYPGSVKLEIEAKVASQQKLQRKDIEKDIEKRNADIRVIKAEGLAEAQRVINKTLTPLYVQHEAIEAYKTLAGSPNTTFIIAPTSPNGTGIPIIIDGANVNQVPNSK